MFDAEAISLVLPSVQAAGMVPDLVGEDVTVEEMQLSRQIGCGCQAGLPGLGNGAALVLQLAPDEQVDWSHSIALSGAFGTIELAQGARLLRGLTGFDVSGEREADSARWSWMQAALRGRLSSTPLACVEQFAWTGLPEAFDPSVLRVTLQTGGHAFFTYGRGTASAWLNFLGHAQWTRNRRPSSAYFGLSSQLPIRIARHTIPAGLADTLRAGDIILPNSPYFMCSGEGMIRWGHLNARVRYQAPGTLTLIALEGNVDLQEHDFGAQWNATQATEETDAPAALDQMPVTLDFELGRSRMSLGELRTLAVGSIVLVDGGSPASLAIVSGGRTLGRGEAVNVNGQLGIRVTQWGPG